MYYCKDYNAASGYFQAVLQILHSEEPEVFADSITIEEENCEILYNLALCSFTSGNEDINNSALMIFEELADVLNSKHRGQLLLLSALIQLSQKNKSKAEKLLKEAVKCDSETISPFLNNQPTTILPLHTASEFACIFPLVPIKLENLPIVYVRPSIVLPRIDIEISLEFINKQVNSLFTLSNVTPRPEAPWLIRNKGSIQFTENIIEAEFDNTETLKSSIESRRESTESVKPDENYSVKSNSKIGIKKTAMSQHLFRNKTFESFTSETKEPQNDFKDEFEQKIKLLCND